MRDLTGHAFKAACQYFVRVYSKAMNCIHFVQPKHGVSPFYTERGDKPNERTHAVCVLSAPVRMLLRSNPNWSLQNSDIRQLEIKNLPVFRNDTVWIGT